MNVTIGGKAFEVADEPKDFWGWVREGRYDLEWAALERHLRPEHVFLDLGAWVGSHSLFASTITQRPVLAIEPDPVAFAILQQNISGRRISACHGAISEHGGKITMGSGLLGASTTRMNPEGGGGIGPWEPGQQFDIPSITLREFSGIYLLDDGPLFIKMDVEGAEEEILADVEFFAEHRPTLYLELHPWWWRDAVATWELVAKIGELYPKKFDLWQRPPDLRGKCPTQLIFTT